MKTKLSYSDQLKDPRWQKKRLGIMNRDGFKCKLCNDESSTLHAHHIVYDYNKMPWEYDDNQIITVCEMHHTAIHEFENIRIVNNGALNVFDFIQEFPWSLMYYSHIENHKGDWIIEFNGTNFFMERIEVLSNLHQFIQGTDITIKFSWDDEFNFCDYIKPHK